MQSLGQLLVRFDIVDPSDDQAVLDLQDREVWALGSGDLVVTVSLNLLMFVLIGGALASPTLLLARYTRTSEPHGVRGFGLFVEGLRGERKDRDTPVGH